MSSLTENKYEIWQKIIDEDWNLDFVLKKMEDPMTFYANRPIIMTAQEVKEKKIFTFSGHKMAIKLANKEIIIQKKQKLSVIDSTHRQLKKNLVFDDNDPISQYLQKEWLKYENLKNKEEYGFYVFYFDRGGNFESVVQFPELPTFKLALTSSGSQLYQPENYNMSWYQIRSILNKSHVLVAGASVASLAAATLIRDGRIGYLSIGDPKGPNATNFNRTAYDCLDVASEETKAIAFARQMHRQDPTQIIYLAKSGFNQENIKTYFQKDQKVDLMLEAVDNLEEKVAILKFAKKEEVPTIQIADVGSKVVLSFNDGKSPSIVLGLNNKKLNNILKNDFLLAAAYFLGLDNVTSDEVGRFLKNNVNTPFAKGTPQLGSTASVAAGLVTEKAVRFILNKDKKIYFDYRRLVFDKKNNVLKNQNFPSFKSLLIDWFLTIKK